MAAFCLTLLEGSSLHFSGAQIWGWRESRFEGLSEAAPGPRRRGGTGVGDQISGPKRGGALVCVQVQLLPPGAALARVPSGVGTRPAARRQLRTAGSSVLRESSGPRGSRRPDLEHVDHKE